VKKNNLKNYINSFIISVILLLFFSAFIDIHIMDSYNMRSTIFENDILIISKLSPGPRLPITPLSIPFVHQHIPFTTIKSYLDIIQLPYCRIKINDLKINDIILFNYPNEMDNPIDKKSVKVSRCLALPGDTFTIYNKEIFVNRKKIDPQQTVNFNYRISLKENTNIDSFFKANKITDCYQITDYIYDCFIPIKIVDKLERENCVKSINIFSSKYRKKWNTGYYTLFPISPYNASSLDFYHTLIIPKKGMIVKLDKYNIFYYKKIIEIYEKNSLQVINDTLFIINDTIAKYYKFKYDYYFVIDDNRDRSNDSRRWGFLPETHIIGKVLINLGNLKNFFLFFKKD